MYVIKNALRCLGRAKGRNVLIGVIALVIATSACLGLSIRQAAENAKEQALAGMSITATISYDRASAMGNISGSRPGGGGMFGGGDFSGERPDPSQFSDVMKNASSLTLEEYLVYAEAPSVSDFYYTLTAYFDGSESLSPVTEEEESEEDSTTDSATGGNSFFPGGGMFGGDFMRGTGDFALVGYSSDGAMTAFIRGSSSMAEGEMFEEGTTALTCVISEELAMVNSLAVGDTIVLTNPALETETYTLTVCGIYTSSENNDYALSVFSASQDPANRIYLSAAALQTMLDASEENSTTVTSANGRETESHVTGTLEATYSFADPDAYYAFEEEVRTLGLSEEYTVSSSDLSSFESSLAPLETLSTLAGWFLLVILGIGGVILVVLNIFNVRERKYEVGVLTAMGMKKWRVAAQFLCEILVVTMIAVTLGAGIGAVSSVPVTNALLAGQVESLNEQQTQMDENFGRPGGGGDFFGAQGGFGGGFGGGFPEELPEGLGGEQGKFGAMFEGAVDYITEVDSAMDLTVVLQMMGVGLLLTIFAGAASVLFIMRYDPLKILANRD